MVAGELILRLKPDFPACAHCLLAEGGGFAAATGRRILDQVRLRYRIRAMEPLYGGLHGEAHREVAQRRFGKHAREKAGADVETATLPDLNQTYVVRVDRQTDLSRLASDLLRDPAVEWVEPNYIYRASAASPLPDDPFLLSSGSWGQSFPDLWGLFQIEAPAAWETTQGGGVIVAVVDGGLDIDHPDIADNVWVNEGEIPHNSIDDDSNGLTDDTYGWDFTRCRRLSPDGSCTEPKEPGPELTDENGHGTHIAGTISAVGRNGIGIVGVAPQAKVMPVKGLDLRGQGATADLAEALVYAAENGAQVINASWSGPPSNAIEMAIEYVTDVFDVVVVASVGNDAGPLERGYCPANLPAVVAVGATTHTGQVASFSNFGGPLDLVAPGGGDSGESIPSPARSILSLLSDDARESEGWAAECRTKCVACEDGSPPVETGDPCLPNYCVEMAEVCTDNACFQKCVRCRDGTVLPPERFLCPFATNTCVEQREVCEPGPWLVEDDYVRGSGTSFAAPHVSGVAALIRSAHPEFTQRQVRQALRNTADDFGPTGWDKQFGYGRVNARRAVEVERIPVAQISAPENLQKVWERDLPFEVRGTVLGSGRDLRMWQLRLAEEESPSNRLIVASGVGEVVEGALGTLSVDQQSILVPGKRYLLELVVDDIDGNNAADSKVFLVPNPSYATIPVPDPFDEGGGNPTLSSDGRRLAISRVDRYPPHDSSGWLWDETDRSLRRFPRSSPFRLSPDGGFLLVGHSARPYELYEIDSGSSVDVFLHGLLPRTPPLLFLSEGAMTAGFVSKEDLDPQIGNIDGSAEVFLFELPDGPVRQITDGPASNDLLEIDDLVMTPDAEHLVFTSTVDLDPTASTRGRSQIFLYDESAKSIRQLTNRTDAARTATRPSLSADGTRVAYQQVGPSGFEGVFLVDATDGKNELLLPAAIGSPNSPILSGDSQFLAFNAFGDLDSAVTNEDLNFEVFLLSLATRQIVQVTDTTGLDMAASALDSTGRLLMIQGSGTLNEVGLSPPLLRALPRRRPNLRPSLSIPATLTAQEGNTLRTLVAASDAEGQPITFYAERVPAFLSGAPSSRLRDLANSELIDHGDGTAELLFTPRYTEAGRYPLRVAAFDEAGGVDVVSVELVILDTQLEGDANCDGKIDRQDISAMVHALFDPTVPSRCATSDNDGDGRVSVNDLVALLLNLP